MGESSAVCSWLMAACMSISCQQDSSMGIPFLSSSSMSSRLSKCASRRRKRVLVKFASEFSGISNLVTSCLASEPCNQFYKSSNGSFFSSDCFFGYGSTTVPLNRRRRKLNQPTAVHTGETMDIPVQSSKEVAPKKKPPTNKRQVVVTGMGLETSIGRDPDAFYSNLLEGVSGISEIEAFNCSQFPTRIAGEIKSFSTDGWVAPKLSKRLDKFMLYMLTAGKKALADGGITMDVMDGLNKARCGVLIGSAMGGMKVLEDGIEALRISYRKMNPFCVPFAITNMGSAILATALGWMGPNYSISTACATSNFCILSAANHIIRGEADMMLCGGSDAAIIPIGLGGFVACRALSQRNCDPTKASRPWDSNRDGFVMGEGAGVLLLEELEHAKKRGANIYAEFLGGSFTCDAYHMTEPHPEGTGVILCIEKALAQLGVRKEDVNYINAHATSTPAGDLKEYQALVRCFGQNQELRVNSTKSMIGHLLGAAGAVEAVATVQAIRTGWVHPNINLETPDDGVDTNVLVGPKKEKLDIKVALSNSFGFGGHNSSILFAPYK
ncbi:3-oxoacyl-[acyl-carrier-protein] synthase II, chloroplastic-like [Olea europaea var. sylvestris]|uniref:3-oxoacyl-[acyl-carrier-protein] synthase II, chloroplastic-like n=1 Tax=Olea europaea var. sylvestris TaxID=158386 RepID=UPI000C1D5469|nr:3-oxoacyl-[acyl-carrier-protein] synthase II, chloroplastic-like [Olea europaea var. sylvestris]XP_022898344.1 3-oxoacyl-[acyl-carrier-protein] synthase II, chloroplastic-like [Olea europaea var. sylvestris]